MPSLSCIFDLREATVSLDTTSSVKVFPVSVVTEKAKRNAHIGASSVLTFGETSSPLGVAGRD